MFNWLYKKYYAEDWSLVSWTRHRLMDGGDFLGYSWTIMLTNGKKPRVIKLGGWLGMYESDLIEKLFARHGILVKDGKISLSHRVAF